MIYGLNYSIAKDVMPGYIEPLGFIFVRAIGATVLFWLVSLFYPWEKIKRKDLGRLILSGFFGVALNQMLFFKGLNSTTPINAAIMMTINPIMVLALSAIFLKEKLKEKWVVLTFGILILFDLIGVDKRYVSNDDFVSAIRVNKPFEANAIDKEILNDIYTFKKQTTTFNFDEEFAKGLTIEEFKAEMKKRIRSYPVKK